MNNAIEIYSSLDGSIQLNVKLENDTVWLTQSQMAELFGVDRTSIVRHIRNIYKSEELDQNSTCAKNAQVRTKGHCSILREIPYYKLGYDKKFDGSQWFANEKDDSFKSSIGQIYQTFGGEDLYPSVEEKAAMLLYLVVKIEMYKC